MIHHQCAAGKESARHNADGGRGGFQTRPYGWQFAVMGGTLRPEVTV